MKKSQKFISFSRFFWVLNSDTYTDFLISDLALADDCLGHLVLVPTPKDKSNGDFDLVDGKIRNADEPGYTFSGFACYRPEFFAGCAVERFSVVPLLRKAADLGQLSGEIYAGRWVDVGTPQKLSDINNAS